MDLQLSSLQSYQTPLTTTVILPCRTHELLHFGLNCWNIIPATTWFCKGKIAVFSKSLLALKKKHRWILYLWIPCWRGLSDSKAKWWTCSKYIVHLNWYWFFFFPPLGAFFRWVNYFFSAALFHSRTLFSCPVCGPVCFSKLCWTPSNRFHVETVFPWHRALGGRLKCRRLLLYFRLQHVLWTQINQQNDIISLLLDWRRWIVKTWRNIRTPFKVKLHI